MTNVAISAPAINAVNYLISNLTFGIVYTSNGADSSQYFEGLTSNTGYESVVFDTVFQGIGLPGNLFDTFNTLFTYVGSDMGATCSNSQDGYCTLNGACSSTNNTALLNEYSFRFDFVSDLTNYMRVPLSTFAQTGSDGNC